MPDSRKWSTQDRIGSLAVHSFTLWQSIAEEERQSSTQRTLDINSVTQKSAEGICITQVLVRLVTNGVSVDRENECPSDYFGGSHVRNLVGLSEEGREWLVVRFNNEGSAKEVAVKLLYCEDNDQGLLLQLGVVLFC